MTRLILIRHGESKANKEAIFSGYTDVELEEKGRMQAQKTAQYVINNYQIDRVYASDLKRAYETGKAVADLLGVQVIPEKGMREVNGGDWEAVKYSELKIRYKEAYGLWLEDIGRCHCTGGESIKELGQRIWATLTKIASENEGKTVVVATHATPIRVMQSLVQTGGLEKMKDIPWVSNASVSELEYNDGEWNFVKIGYDGHMPEIRTELSKDV